MKKAIEEVGFYKFNRIISEEWVDRINNILPNIFEEHEKIRRKNNNPITSRGIAMNALVGNQLFFDLLNHLIDIQLLEELEKKYFKSKFILNSFTALSNLPDEDDVFHKKIHRDVKGFTGNIPVMLNMLIMLDDFTIENGATLLYEKTHLDEFYDLNDLNLKQKPTYAIGKAGDVLIWNSNLLHSSGINKTKNERRALAITFSLPYYKQLLDYPRAIGDTLHFDNLMMRRLLGFESRVPASISEWYAPQNELLYKK